MGKKTFCILILDGLGISRKTDGNAVALAKTPTLDNLLKTCPHSKLKASGTAVGLPEGQIGGSEVGHIHIGSGRLILQELSKINRHIEDRSFFKDKALLNAIRDAKRKGSALHMMGLLSDGGVHSHIDHLFAILDMCKKNNVKEVYIHTMLDGRDTPPKSAARYISQLKKKLKETGTGKIATIIGRYYAMDRDNRWDRTGLAYDAIAGRIGREETDPIKAIKDSYSRGETDEFIRPIILDDRKMRIEDSMIFFNFREDRARQITKMFVWNRKFRKPKLCGNFTTFTQYEEDLKTNVAFSEHNIKNTLGEVLSKKNLTQLRIAETEKFAHVTYFFSGGREDTFKGEDRILINSPKVASYDLKPQMSAGKITDAVTRQIGKRKYDLIVLNYANPDMVGHTGKLDCAIKAIETVDSCLSKVLKSIEKIEGTALVISDHGNSEQMIYYKTGMPHTAHTLNPVHCIYFGRDRNIHLKDGALHNIAPTALELMGIRKPKDMTSNSLIRR